MYPALPSPQGSVPATVSSSTPPDRILVAGIYYQLVPPPHSVVVAQSSIPTPALAPVNTPEALPLSAPNGVETTESDAESIVVVTIIHNRNPRVFRCFSFSP